MTTRTDVLRIRLETTNDGQVRASLAGVATSADAVAKSTSGATAATEASTQAMKGAAGAASELTAAQAARAETEDEAIARIHAMVEASLSADQAAQARAAAEREAALAQGENTAATAEQVAATRALVEAQTAAMSGYWAQLAPVRELEALLEKHTLTTADVARAEALLDEAQARGVISSAELSQAFEALDAAKIRDTEVTHANTAAQLENEAAHINSRVAYSADALITDAATGQFSRSRREIAALANESGLLQKLLSPLGLAFTAVAAAAGVMVAGFIKGEEQTAAFTLAISASGNAIGATTGQLESMTQHLGALNGNYAGAREAILALAKDGRVAAADFVTMGQAALDMSRLTGQSVGDAAKQLAALASQPAKAVEQYHLLTVAQYDQITALEKQGRTVEAEAIAERDYAQTLKQRAQEVQDSAGIIARAGQGIKAAWDAAWNAVDAIGRPDTDAQQLAKLQAKAEELKNALVTGYKAPINTGHGLIAQPDGDPTQTGAELQQVNAAIAALQTKMITEGFARTNQQISSLATAQAVSARQALKQFMTPDQKLQADLDQAALNKARGLYGVVDPKVKAEIEAEFNNEVQQAHLAYQRALKRDNPGASKVQSATAEADRYIASLNASSLNVLDDGPLTKYSQGIAKLLDQYDQWIAKGVPLAHAQADFDQGVQALTRDLATAQAKQDAADKAYSDQLASQLRLRQREIDMQVASVGMGSKEYQQLQQLNQVYQEFDRQLAQLNKERDRGSISTDQYDARLKALKTDEQATVNAVLDGYARMDAAQADWRNGAVHAMQDWADQGANVAGQTSQLFTDAFGNMNDALVNFVQTGKLDFKQLVDSFIADLVRMELRIVESRILMSILGGGVGDSAGVGLSMDTTGGAVAFGTSAMGSYATGGAFDAGGAITAFASGGIVSKPTLFAFANGTGLMGEAGPEAIMPLTRGPDGKLGVQSQGGGTGELQVEVNITNQSGQAVQGKQTGQRQDGRKVIIDMVLQAVAADVATGGQTAKAMQNRFGLQRRGVPVGG